MIKNDSFLFFYSIFLSVYLEWGEGLEVVLPGRGKMTYFWERRVGRGGDWRQAETIQINYKMNLMTFLKMLLFYKYFSAIF